MRKTVPILLICTLKHANAYARAHTHTHKHRHRHIHTHRHRHTDAQTHTLTHIHKHSRTNAHSRVFTHAYTLTQTHSLTYTLKHRKSSQRKTHTSVCFCFPALCLSLLLTVEIVADEWTSPHSRKHSERRAKYLQPERSGVRNGGHSTKHDRNGQQTEGVYWPVL